MIYAAHRREVCDSYTVLIRVESQASLSRAEPWSRFPLPFVPITSLHRSAVVESAPAAQLVGAAASIPALKHPSAGARN